MKRARLAVMLLAWMPWLAADAAAGQATSPPESKQAFVQAIGQFAQAIAGSYGDERGRVSTAIAAMRRALAEWDGAIRARESASAPGPATAEDHFVLGAMYLDRGRVDDALRELAAAIVSAPEAADIYTLQGLAYIRAGRPAEAAGAFATAARLEPENPAPHYTLGHYLRRHGPAEQAAGAFKDFQDSEQQALAMPAAGATAAGAPFRRLSLVRQPSGVAPIFPPALYQPGFALLNDGRYEEAIAGFETAAPLDVLGSQAGAAGDHIAQGAALLRQGMLDPALTHLKAAIDLAPDSSEAHRILGIVYRADDQNDAAIEQFSSAIRLNPRDERSRIALADSLISLGRAEEAERELTASLAAISGSGQAHYALARLYQSVLKPAEALREFTAALDRHPLVGLDYLYQSIINLQLMQSNVDAAIDAYLSRIDVNPNDAEVHRRLGETYLQENRDDEALTEYLAAVLINPRDVRAFAGAGQVLLRNSRYDHAASAARHALAIDSDNKEARLVLGSALMRLGETAEGTTQLQEFQRLQAAAIAAQTRELQLKMLEQEAASSIEKKDLDQAIALLQQAASLDPRSADAHIKLGVVLMNAGRSREALDSFEKALALNGGPECHRYLARVYQALGRADDARVQLETYRHLKQEQLRKAGAGR